MSNERRQGSHEAKETRGPQRQRGRECVHKSKCLWFWLYLEIFFLFIYLFLLEPCNLCSSKLYFIPPSLQSSLSFANKPNPPTYTGTVYPVIFASASEPSVKLLLHFTCTPSTTSLSLIWALRIPFMEREDGVVLLLRRISRRVFTCASSNNFVLLLNVLAIVTFDKNEITLCDSMADNRERGDIAKKRSDGGRNSQRIISNI